MLQLYYAIDENDQDLQLPARSSVFAWVRTGHSADGSPASQLPYEFALLYLEDTRGKIIETRVGVGLRRVPGTGFPTERAIEAICSTSERVVFARSGGDLLVFKLENDGWTWKMDGVLNTTLVD